MARKATEAGARMVVRKGSLRDSELPRIVRQLNA